MIKEIEQNVTGLHAFDHVAAGHEGVLSDESGALVIKPCTEQELSFYTIAAKHPKFQKWMPTFYGTLECSSGPEPPSSSGAPAAAATNNRNASIVLRNLTHGFEKPCVLDVKLGARLWDDDAPQEKRERLDTVSQATTSGSLGLRIAGMRVWKGEEAGGYKVFDKHYGRGFKADNCIEGFSEYLSGDISEEQKKMIVGRFLGKVEEVQEILERQESRMYSASLLFVYEGDGKALEAALKEEEENARKPPKDDEDGEKDEKVKVEEVKLIDFAHATWTPDKGPDENALKGVRNTKELFAKLLSER